MLGGPRRITVFLLSAVLTLAVGLIAPQAVGAPSVPSAPVLPGDHDGTIVVDGIERHFILHVPIGYDGHRPLPLVYVLHGFSATAGGMVGITRMSDKADQEGFFVVYPQGTTVGPDSEYSKCGCPDDPAAWNTGTNPEFDLHADDVGFIRQLTEHLEQRLRVDPRRVYATGLSSGGGMSHRLGVDLPDLLAAVAPVAGSIGLRADENAPYLRIPDATGSIPVMIFHGQADTHVLYGGGPAPEGPGLDALPVRDAVRFWTDANRCQGPVRTETSSNGNVIVENHEGCFANADVVLVTSVNGIHAWPTAQGPSEISATQTMWEFFSQHALTA